MAFTVPTLAGALGANDINAYLSSLSGLVAGQTALIDKEAVKLLSIPASTTYPVPLQRGVEGTAVSAHALGAQVKVGAASTPLQVGDFNQPSAGASSMAVLPGSYSRDFASYSASGAITLPKIGADMVAMLNGTSVLTMTLANPPAGSDGSRLVIIANGKAAHTVTYAAGLGNGGGTMDVATFSAASQMGCELMACGGFWVLIGNGIASAGTQVGGPTWA